MNVQRSNTLCPFLKQQRKAYPAYYYRKVSKCVTIKNTKTGNLWIVFLRNTGASSPLNLLASRIFNGLTKK